MKIDILTQHESLVSSTTRPYRLIDNPPKWFKEQHRDVVQLPKDPIKRIKELMFNETLGDNKSYKCCPALLQFMKTTIVMPAPCDIRIYQEGPRWFWQTPAPEFTMQEHPKHSMKGFKQNKSCLKLQTPWKFSSPDSEARLLWHQPHFHDETRWETAVGTYDVSHWSICNIIMFFEDPKPNEERAIEISAGTPLAYLSTTDSSLDLNVKVVNDIEYKRLENKTLNWSFSAKKVFSSFKKDK